MEKVNIELTVEEVNGILNVLAELPTKTNAWPLFNKIQEQAQAQAQQAATDVEKTGIA